MIRVESVKSYQPSQSPEKTPRSFGSSLAENQHAKAEVLGPREAREDAQSQMIHGVVLIGIVIEKPVPAVAPELGAEGLLPYRAHAYRKALVTYISPATTMVVHLSRDDALPERRRKRVNLGVSQAVQLPCIMCTRADYHGALWKESLHEIRMKSNGH